MTHARLWLGIFLCGFAGLSALVVLKLFTPIPYGDLTRIGRISDYEFGWRTEPPKVAAEVLRAAPVRDADILVIGDSFSATHGWQSVLTQAGYRVTTTFWGRFDEVLCGDFDGWLDRAGFRGKLIVIESVERLLDMRLMLMRKCSKMKNPFRASIEPPSPPIEHVPGFSLNWDAKVSSGWLTYINTRHAKQSTGDEPGFRVRARKVPNGCMLFSHRFCQKALFLNDDNESGELPVESVERMQAFTQAHKRWSISPTTPICRCTANSC